MLCLALGTKKDQKGFPQRGIHEKVKMPYFYRQPVDPVVVCVHFLALVNSLKIKFLGRIFLGYQRPTRRDIPDPGPGMSRTHTHTPLFVQGTFFCRSRQRMVPGHEREVLNGVGADRVGLKFPFFPVNCSCLLLS